MAKKAVNPGTYLSPVPAFLISSGNCEENYNVSTASWTGTICSRPPMAYVSFRPATLSYHTITACKEFVINLPTADMLNKVDLAGRLSGKDVNKWKELSLTPVKADKVNAPLVAECPVNIECKVVDEKELGSHKMFIAEVVAVHTEERFIRDGRIDLSGFETIANVGGWYMNVEDAIARQGFTVEKK